MSTDVEKYSKEIEKSEVIEAELIPVYTEYDTNNSGGSWWLTDQNWIDLEKAGWKVEWGGRTANLKSAEEARSKRYMDALATTAKRDLPIEDAIAEWESITGESAKDEGCPCCGPPHSFTEYNAINSERMRSATIVTNPTLEIR